MGKRGRPRPAANEVRAGPKSSKTRREELVVDEDFSGGKWYECVPTSGQTEKVSLQKLDGLAALAEVANAYAKGGRKGKHSSGKNATAGEKLAALTLTVQASPVHTLEELKSLLNSAHFGQGSGGVYLLAAKALADLFLHDLLPHSRRLEDWKSTRVTKSAGLREKAYAAFEAELKTVYAEFLSGIDLVSKSSSVEHVRAECIAIAATLLQNKPEAERLLLDMLVNKLGDPDKKCAAKASWCLAKLVEKHPVMKELVAVEVCQMMHRHKVPKRAIFHGMTFLNQIRFQKTQVDTKLARRLVEVYLGLFRGLVTDHVEDTSNQKLVTAVLTGINRAFPFTRAEDYDQYDSQFDSLFKLAHSASMGSALQSMRLLLQVSKARDSLGDRFYRVVYSRLLDEEVRVGNKQAMFLSLVYQAMKMDTNEARVHALAKRLLQAACQSSAGFAAGSILAVAEVMSIEHPGMLKKFVTCGDEPRDDVEINGHYNAGCRDPAFAKADLTGLWELTALTLHFHPSVAKFARCALTLGRSEEYSGDPVSDFSLVSFLDRLSYKKPQNRITGKLRAGRSSTAGDSLSGGGAAVNTVEFMSQRAHTDDERYFTRFFSSPLGRKMLVGETKPDLKESDGNESEEFDAALAKDMADVDDAKSDYDGVEAEADSLEEELEAEMSADESDDEESESGDLAREDTERRAKSSNVSSFAPASDYMDD